MSAKMAFAAGRQTANGHFVVSKGRIVLSRVAVRVWPAAVKRADRRRERHIVLTKSESYNRVTFNDLRQFAARFIGCSMKNLLALVVMALLAAPSFTKADVDDRLYDFTDAYYFQNGVNPGLISGRMQPGPTAVTDTPIFSFQRNVRALLTLSAYDNSGNLRYFTVLGGLSANAFTLDAAGRNARATADKFIEYLFPQAGTDPIGFTFRQSALLDMRNGYFSNDPLGLWLHVWVNYTSKALTTREGKKFLDSLAAKNGRALDGTPIIASTSDIDSLFSKGYITKTSRPLSDSLRYAICPVIEDPTDGGIAPDQFLALPLKADGTPVEPKFLTNFQSLQSTGDWAN
jgi:hypothetical protein